MGLVVLRDFDGGDEYVEEYSIKLGPVRGSREGTYDGDYLGARQERGRRRGADEVVGSLAVQGEGMEDGLVQCSRLCPL